MDQVKIGKFIAALRKQKDLTQEALGEKLGVTNKTISRWENGNYMPDIEMLQLLSNEFGVSINELLSGERLPDEEFRKKADENIVEVSKPERFSRKEREVYFQKKWRREHVGLFVMAVIILAAASAAAILTDHTYLLPLVAAIEIAWLYNAMMKYVEKNLYDR